MIKRCSQEFTLVQLLKDCTKKKDLCEGARLHEDIVKKRLHEKSPYVASSLISMYAKCGELGKAQKVLDGLPVRDVFVWSALIAGYSQQGYGHEALKCFSRMKREGLSPNEITFTCVLKACGIVGAVGKGENIHDEIISRGLLEKNVVLGNALVDMYVKCGDPKKAQQVFNGIPVRDIVSWSALIAGYARHGQGYEALECIGRMQQEGLHPNEVTLASILKACGSIGAIEKGKQIHDEIANRGFLEKNMVLGNALLDMYTKCGDLAKAQEVLEVLPVRDVVSWSTLIAGYTQEGYGYQALDCFERMQSEGIVPNEITFISALKACGCIGAIEKGERIHDDIANRGLLHKSTALGNALVDMYAKCGMLIKAHKFIKNLPVRDIISWNTLIAGYVQKEQSSEAIKCCGEMKEEGFLPNEITFAFILKACGCMGAIEQGKQIHDEIVKEALLEKHVVLGAALIDMYAKFGMLQKAHEVLEGLPGREIVSWNALIAGYVQHELGYQALACFDQMRTESFSPNETTFISILKACSSIGAIDKGRQIHGSIVDGGMLKKNIMVGNALVDMYCKCGAPSRAQEVLEDLPVRDAVSWNALIAGYAKEGHVQESFDCFIKMQMEGLLPDEVTFTCILKVCSSAAVGDMGIQIHSNVVSRHLLEKSVILGTALVDMYAKCGLFTRATQVLESIPIRDTLCWNAFIAGYAQEGQYHDTVKCFEQMELEGLFPDEVTFLSMLRACCHSGKIDQAQSYYENMISAYGITPTLEHNTCMVSVFAYAGLFEKAISVIMTIPSFDSSVWLALLSACRKWGNLKLGKPAFDQVIQLDDNISAACALMANIYSASGMFQDAESVQGLMMKLKRCAPKKINRDDVCKNIPFCVEDLYNVK